MLASTIFTDYAPLWGLGGTALVLIVGILFYFKGDNRWVRKDEAREKADALAKERQAEVDDLKRADAEIKQIVDALTVTMETNHNATRLALHGVRNDMTAGFAEVNRTITAGILSISKDVAVMQGRIAGAGGIKQQGE